MTLQNKGFQTQLRWNSIRGGACWKIGAPEGGQCGSFSSYIRKKTLLIPHNCPNKAVIKQEGSLSLTCLWGVVLFSNWADPCLAYQVSITNPCRRICGPIVDRSHPVARLITRLFSHLLSPGRGRKDSTAGRESCCRPSEWRTESLAVIKGWQQSRRRETSAKTKALLWWNIQGEAAHSNALLPYAPKCKRNPKAKPALQTDYRTLSP